MKVEKLEALRSARMFQNLPEAELRALAERAVVQHLEKGQVLFLAGGEARGMYVVVKGAIRAFRENEEGREQVIHVERPGSTIAEVPVFDGGPYPSTAAAEEEAIVLFISRGDVKRLCLEFPRIAIGALQLLAGRLRQTAALVELLSLHEVDQRLARFLISEARRKGRRIAAGVSLELTSTNQQIASRIGTVREVVSRALRRLQLKGYIHVRGRTVVILDEAGLADYAQ